MTETVETLGRLAIVVLVALLAVPILMMTGFGVPMMGWWMMGPSGGAGFGGWPLFMLVGGLVPLALLLAVGYLLYRAATGNETDSALEELRRAYARGELSDEEYDRRRERLERSQ
ncbi:SHOCT domain-containing protein [Halegenticoccus tardaugens]|uniref:SHOCT domain-containing protein n=1 Tax=Halegenticoccus tardaugens TaxID=2071624 RepID=UPI00100A5C27|nr:SHOCT domain-containing protein [Halegenticoccus tardaugens]